MRFALVACVCVLLCGCAVRADPPASANEPVPLAPERATIVGKATYYADSLAGRRTASGDVYDPGALTAAHRTLPFGTEVEVRRRDGRSVRVIVNDRGPFGRAHERGVIIDLSRAAAERIGMIREGVVEIALAVVSMPPPKPKKARRAGRR